jgi:hypothetical protein
MCGKRTFRKALGYPANQAKASRGKPFYFPGLSKSAVAKNTKKEISAKSAISERHNILPDLLEILYGHSVSDKIRILSLTTAGRLDKAFQKNSISKNKGRSAELP